MLRTTKKLGTKRGKIKAFALVLVFCVIFIRQGKRKSLSAWDIYIYICTHIDMYIYTAILKQHSLYFESILSSSLL